MSNSAAFTPSVFVSGSEALLRGRVFFFASQRLAGGLGGEANQKNFGGLLADPMLARTQNTRLTQSNNAPQNSNSNPNKPIASNSSAPSILFDTSFRNLAST